MTQLSPRLVRSRRTPPFKSPINEAPTSQTAPLLDAVAQLPAAIALFDRQLHCLGMSQRWRDLFAPAASAAATAQPLRQMLPHASRRWLQACQRSLETGETVEGEAEPVRLAEDRLLWLRWRCSPWQSASGTIDGVWLWSEPVAEPRASDQQLRTALDQAFQFISLLSLDGRVLEANQTALNYGGLPRAAVLGQPFWEVPWWPLSRKVKRQLQAAIAKAARGRFIRLDIPVLDAYQQVSVVLDVSVKPVRDATGQVALLILEGRDISQRKTAETTLASRLAAQRQQLQMSEREFRTIFERAGVGLNFQNLDGRFIRVNQRWCEILGYSEDELLGLQFRDITHPDDRDLEQPYLDRLLAGEIPNFTIEKRYWHRQGFIVWVSLTKTVIRDAEGRPQHFITAIADISERKRAEAEQVRLLAALDATTDLVAIANADGYLCHLNRAGRKLVGLSPEAAIAHRHWLDLFSQSERETMVNQCLPALLHHGIWQGEGHLQHRDGAEIPVSQVAIAHTNARGEIEFFSNIARDISDRKRAEATLRQQAADLEAALHQLQATQAQLIQTEKMSSLGQLVAGIAHEINNPVNFIYGNLEHANIYIRDLLELLACYQAHYPEPAAAVSELAATIEIDFLMEDLPKLLDSMRIGSERIKTIVASLRTFSRTDEAASKAVDLHAGLDSTLMLLHNRCQPRAGRPGIEIIRNYGDLPLLECYPSQLNQVFMNLIANAIDALEERDAHRSREAIQQQPSQIAIATHLTTGGCACIHIRDNGPGIPPEVQQRLFDPFFTTKPVGKGTGLGLSISYQIVTERHGGRLTCRSEPGQGTEFIVAIPTRQT